MCLMREAVPWVPHCDGRHTEGGDGGHTEGGDVKEATFRRRVDWHGVSEAEAGRAVGATGCLGCFAYASARHGHQRLARGHARGTG